MNEEGESCVYSEQVLREYEKEILWTLLSMIHVCLVYKKWNDYSMVLEVQRLVD
jgi:hypothetical protein